MPEKVCHITECRAQLLGMDYYVFILDTGQTVPTCRRCARKIKQGMHGLTLQPDTLKSS